VRLPASFSPTVAPEHPGGMKILLRWAGQDATSVRCLHSPSFERPVLTRRSPLVGLVSCRRFLHFPLYLFLTPLVLTLFARSEPIHPPGTLEQYLPKDRHLGPVDLSGLEIVAKEDSQEEKDRKVREKNKPPIDECLSLYDFEVRSSPSRLSLPFRLFLVDVFFFLFLFFSRLLLSSLLICLFLHRPSPNPSFLLVHGPTVRFNFLFPPFLKENAHPLSIPLTDSSGADDEITMRENRSAYQRIWFRPRILRDVEKIDFSTTILGHKVRCPSHFPIFWPSADVSSPLRPQCVRCSAISRRTCR
jgi:hypothetical protein